MAIKYFKNKLNECTIVHGRPLIEKGSRPGAQNKNHLVVTRAKSVDFCYKPFLTSSVPKLKVNFLLSL